ncbi:hypothetical protein [Pseudanabaena minima]|uniref:hypothetical protein n=1 Tax=Pseudanabaena minima TaxID=890415 RepID=UPI003DA932DF
MTILEKVVNTVQQLPIEQQKQALAFVEFLAFNLNNQSDDDSLIETNALLQVPDLLDQVESARQEYRKGEALTMQQVFG